MVGWGREVALPKWLTDIQTDGPEELSSYHKEVILTQGVMTRLQGQYIPKFPRLVNMGFTSKWGWLIPGTDFVRFRPSRLNVSSSGIVRPCPLPFLFSPSPLPLSPSLFLPSFTYFAHLVPIWCLIRTKIKPFFFRPNSPVPVHLTDLALGPITLFLLPLLRVCVRLRVRVCWGSYVS